MPLETTSRDVIIGADRRDLKHRITRYVSVTLAIAVIVAAIAVGIATLHVRADAAPPITPLAPLTVSVESIRVQPGHEVTRRYVGRIEPARTTRIAFERSGLVTDVDVDEGDRVTAGQLLARLDVDPLAVERQRLVAERARVGSQLTFAQQTLDRRGTLAGRAVSRQLFDEVRFEVEGLEAQIDEIDARINAIDIDIAKSTITAPFAGTIAERALDQGSVVTAGTEVVRLLETDHMQARIGLPPDVAARLRVGATHSLTVLGTTVVGTLVTLRPDLETGTRTVVALFDVPDTGRAAAGELIDLSLARAVPGAGAWVPLTALSEGEKGLWSLFVIVDDPAGPLIAREAVELLHIADQRAFVRGTFADDARFVTGGTNRVTPGQRVRISEG